MEASRKFTFKNKWVSLTVISFLLTLSAFMHLWNPIGLPYFHTDEGHYILRAINVLNGGILQESDRYDHPYFGQLFLASLFKIVGYPQLFKGSTVSANNIEMLYLVPRIIMGILAVIDTYLIFKLAEIKFNRNIALISSFLFVILPYSLMNRMVLLDNLQLPFLLSSVLFATYLKFADVKARPLFIVASGTMMGICLFTKLSAMPYILLVVYLVLSYTNKKLGYVLIWIIPVLAVPIIWPVHALLIGDFDAWYNGILYQTGRTPKPLIFEFGNLLVNDSALAILGIAGVIYGIIKKNFFIMLSTIPFLLFLYLINYVSSFHFIIIMPFLCVASGFTINGILKSILNIKSLKMNKNKFSIISVIGMVSILSYLLVTTSEEIVFFKNSTDIKAQTIVTSLLKDRTSGRSGKGIFVTIIANPKHFWIPKDVYNIHKDRYESYYATRGLERTLNSTTEYILVVDSNYMSFMNMKNNRANLLKILYDNSYLHARIKNGKIAYTTGIDPKVVEIRTSWKK